MYITTGRNTPTAHVREVSPLCINYPHLTRAMISHAHQHTSRPIAHPHNRRDTINTHVLVSTAACRLSNAARA